MKLTCRAMPLWSRKASALRCSLLAGPRAWSLARRPASSGARDSFAGPSALQTPQRHFGFGSATRVLCASKRLRGLRKRAGGEAAAGAAKSKSSTSSASSPAPPPSPATQASSASATSVLAPPVAPPEHLSPRNAKEAAEVANARLDHAIQENARQFVTRHEQQQQREAAEGETTRPSMAAASSPPSASAVTGSARRVTASRGNRARKRRAATPSSARETTANTTTKASHTPVTASSSSQATEVPAVAIANDAASSAEDDAEAAAIAAAVEKVLNAASALPAAHPEPARAAPTTPPATSSPSASTAAKDKKSARRLSSKTAATAGSTHSAAKGSATTTTATTATRAHKSAHVADGEDDASAGATSAADDAVARARVAITSGKHKILAAAAAAVVTDVIHARASEEEQAAAAAAAAAARMKHNAASSAVANRPASVSSFASSLRGHDITLASVTAASALPPHVDGTDAETAMTTSASTKKKSTAQAIKKTKKGKAQAHKTPSSATLTTASEGPAAASSASLSAGALSNPTPTGPTTARAGASCLSPPAVLPPPRRGRKLSDEAAAQATATAIVRRLTAFTGLNREQQAKLKRLLLTRQHRLLRRRRRLLVQRSRHAATTAAAAEKETAAAMAAAGGLVGFALAGAANGGQQGALERTMTVLAPATVGAKGSTSTSANRATAKPPTRATTTKKKSSATRTAAPASAVATAPATHAAPSVKPPTGVNPLLAPDYRECVLTIFDRLAEVNLALGEKYKTQSYVAAVERLKRGDTLFQLLPPHLAAVDERTLHLYGDAGQIQEFLHKRELARTCTHIPFIGDKLKRKITEILETGELAELAELEQKPIIQAIKSLTQVHGVGPRTAITLYKNFGITNVDELKTYVEAQDKKAAKSGTDAGATGGSGGKSKKKAKDVFTANDAQRLGLKYHKDILQRIPHSEGRLHEAFLKLRLKKHFGEADYELVVCGSYRRACPDSGDIDVLITTTSRSNRPRSRQALPPQEVLSAFLDVLREENYVEATLAQGPTKFMGMCRLRTSKDSSRRFPARRLDARFVDAESFAAALLYFTGSKNFNVLMRAKAIKHNFILNEYGLFRNQSNNLAATTKLHEAISKLSKAQFYGGQPNDILKQQEKRLKEEADAAATTTTATSGAVSVPKQKIYTKAELQELYTMWQAVEAQRVRCKTEEDVFAAIGMPYVSPKDRNL